MRERPLDRRRETAAGLRAHRCSNSTTANPHQDTRSKPCIRVDAPDKDVLRLVLAKVNGFATVVDGCLTRPEVFGDRRIFDGLIAEAREIANLTFQAVA